MIETKDIREFADDLLKNAEYNRYYSALAYVPFVGWMLPLYLKRDVRECQFNGKQGLLLAVAAAVPAVVLSILLYVFLPREWRLVKFLVVILIYLIYLAYFAACVYGIVKSLKDEDTKLPVPVMERYMGRLDL